MPKVTRVEMLYKLGERYFNDCLNRHTIWYLNGKNGPEPPEPAVEYIKRLEKLSNKELETLLTKQPLTKTTP